MEAALFAEKVWKMTDELVFTASGLVSASEYPRFCNKLVIAYKYLLALDEMLPLQEKKLPLINSIKLLWIQLHHPLELERGGLSICQEIEDQIIVTMERLQKCWKLAGSLRSKMDIEDLLLSLNYLGGIFQQKEGKFNLGDLNERSFGHRFLSLVFDPDFDADTMINSTPGKDPINATDPIRQPIIKTFRNIRKGIDCIQESNSLSESAADFTRLASITRSLLSKYLATGLGKECKNYIPELELLIQKKVTPEIPVFFLEKGTNGAWLICSVWKICLGALWTLVAYYRSCNWKKARYYIDEAEHCISALKAMFGDEDRFNRSLIDHFAFEFACFKFDLCALIQDSDKIHLGEKCLKHCAKLATKETVPSVLLRLGLYSQICQRGKTDSLKFAMLCYDYIGIHVDGDDSLWVYAKFLQCLLFSCNKDSRHLVDPSNYLDLILNVRERLTLLAESNSNCKALLALLEISQVLRVECDDHKAAVTFDTRKAKSELLVVLQLSQCNLGNHLLTLTVLLFLLDLFKISGDVSQQHSFQKAVSGLSKKIETGVMDEWISLALHSFK